MSAGVLALDAHEFDEHLKVLLSGLALHGVDGVCVVYFRGTDTGVVTARNPAARGERVAYPELRALAIQSLQAAQEQSAS